jgi:hypothetical protein
MSFHEDSFHETQAERKYFEDKKQTALRYIDHTIKLDPSLVDKFILKKLTVIRRLVNDI